MPNLHPENLPIHPADRGWPGCSNATCVDVVEGGDTFARIVSTRRPDAPGVPFDADEIVKFIDEVKAGHWDGLRERAGDAVADQVFA